MKVSEPRNQVLVVICWILSLLAVGVWAFVIGSMTPAVTNESLQGVRDNYKSVTVHEDGSYVGLTAGAVQVTGCIDGAPCEGEL